MSLKRRQQQVILKYFSLKRTCFKSGRRTKVIPKSSRSQDMNSHHQNGCDDGRVRQIVHFLKQSPEDPGKTKGSAPQTAESIPSGLTTRRERGEASAESSDPPLTSLFHFLHQHLSTCSTRRRITSGCFSLHSSPLLPGSLLDSEFHSPETSHQTAAAAQCCSLRR